MNWTPDLSPHYLIALLGPLAETLEMAAGAMLIATLSGMVLSIWITARLPGARVLYGLLAALRSIPDLTLAIFCVIIAGIGPGAGLLAVAIFYSAAMGKVFSDLLRAADPGPVEALRATGAPSIVVVVFAHLQLRLQDLMTYGRYEFECAVRTSVIVGAVGGGGLGAEIAGSINAFDFRRTATLVLVLIAVMIGMERLLRYGRVAWIFAVAGIVSIGTAWTERLHLGHAWATFGSMLPPRLPEGALRLIPRLLAETLFMAVAGTLVGALVALPLGLCSSRRFAPWWLAFPVRRFLEILRAVPEVVWGLILITAAGVCPMAGAAALAIHSAGCLGRLFA
ncbi:MAG TPA: ABC transporter permease subunit, partial [Candidatus Binataceae bacterium]